MKYMWHWISFFGIYIIRAGYLIMLPNFLAGDFKNLKKKKFEKKNCDISSHNGVSIARYIFISDNLILLITYLNFIHH